MFKVPNFCFTRFLDLFMSRGNKKSEVKGSSENKNYWLQLGLKIFAESTGWIVIPVIGALFLGRWLDDKYGTEPLYFLGITLMAFIISSIGMGITGIKYIKLIEKDEELKKQQNNPLAIPPSGKALRACPLAPERSNGRQADKSKSNKSINQGDNKNL